MTIRDRAKRRPQFESLEVRETPSGFSHPVGAAVVHFQKFSGNGTATPTSETPLPSGVVELVGPASGQSPQLGGFSGSATADLASNRKFTASLVIGSTPGTPGSSITLNTHGTFTKAGKAVSAFTAGNGTGLYSGYTGSGTVKMSINYNTSVLTFSFTGKYKP